MVLHELNLAAKVCHRLVLLDRGEVRRDGPPTEVVRADLLSAVYGTELHVEPDPRSGRPTVSVPL